MQDTRRFVLGFTICEFLMRVWVFDRLGGIVSEQFNINDDGLQFVFAILGFLWMNEEGLGFDPTIKSENQEGSIEINRNGSTERIIIDHVMQRARCIAGRATTCWKAHPERQSKMLLVIKDSWQYPERDEEGDLLREATNKGVINVARYYHHKVVQIRGMNDDIQSNTRRGLDIRTAVNYRLPRPIPRNNIASCVSREGRASTSTSRKRSSSQTSADLPSSKRSCSTSSTKAPGTPRNRVHRRVIRDYGILIYKASSRSALLAAFERCIVGHESLHKTCHLHRDISINNLMVDEDDDNPSWPSFLIDLDLAVKKVTGSCVRSKGGNRNTRFHGNRGATGRAAFFHARSRVIFLGLFLDMHSL
jgi:hypothetical protein